MKKQKYYIVKSKTYFDKEQNIGQFCEDPRADMWAKSFVKNEYEKHSEYFGTEAGAMKELNKIEKSCPDHKKCEKEFQYVPFSELPSKWFYSEYELWDEGYYEDKMKKSPEDFVGYEKTDYESMTKEQLIELLKSK